MDQQENKSQPSDHKIDQISVKDLDMPAKNAKKDGKAIINQDASLNDASTDDDQQLPPIEIKRAPKVEETNV